MTNQVWAWLLSPSAPLFTLLTWRICALGSLTLTIPSDTSISDCYGRIFMTIKADFLFIWKTSLCFGIVTYIGVITFCWNKAFRLLLDKLYNLKSNICLDIPQFGFIFYVRYHIGLSKYYWPL